MDASQEGAFRRAVHMSRYSLGVVGAGRVGAVLAAALRAAGHDVVAVSGGSAASRTRVETLIPGVGVSSPREVARGCDLLLLTVPDDDLAALVDDLVASGSVRSGQVVVHTSGRHGTAVLAPAAAVGAVVVAMHPAMTFTGTDVDLARLPGTVFGLTCDDAARPIGERLVDDLGGEVAWLPEQRRALYHAALAHGSNHLVTLVTQAMEVLREAGAPDPAATLRPLLTAALDNALSYGDAAQTGPVVRGDRSTVSAHLHALEGAPASTLDSYLAMARATVDHAVAGGRLGRERGREIIELLDAAVWDATAAAMTGHPDTHGSR
jgi:predicted short-subunit dehydrogenase-like oxidoreductase (DUF2520 family)